MVAQLPKLPKLPQLPKLPSLRGGLDSTEGLYSAAHDAGLKDKADEIVRLNSGEEHKKFFAGGFISDTFDVLNIASYGVVGTLKGKGFAEGIKNRESFSDQDALGRYGLVGVIGGIALDIVFDPFTYIAPWKILSHVPGLSKAAKAGKERILGKATEQVIDENIDEALTPLTTEARKYKTAEEFVNELRYGKTVSPVLKDNGTGFLDVAKTEKTLPPIKDGYERFYRAESPTIKHGDVWDEKSMKVPSGAKYGDSFWLTKSLGYADYYKQSYGKEAKIYYIDLPKGVAKIDTRFDDEFLVNKSQLTDIWNKAQVVGQRTFQSNFGGVPVVKELADKVGWMLGKDPAFRETYQTMMRNTGIGIKKAHQLFKLVAKFDPKTSDKLLTRLPAEFEGGVERIARKDINLLQRELSPEEFATVKEAWDTIDNLGKELVDLGVLSKGKFEENIGSYIQNNYTEYLTAKNKGTFASRALGIKGTKKRVEELTAEKAKELGQIENPAYLLGKTIIDMVKDVENAKFFRVVNEKWGTDVAQEGFTKLPDTLKWGDLAGKYIPDDMAKYVNETLNPSAAFGHKLVGQFKYMKVVFSPATHFRNIISNKILNWWKLGIGPWRLDLDVAAIKDIRTKSEWYQRAQRAGMSASSYASNELPGLLTHPSGGLDASYGMKKVRQVEQYFGDMYQHEEDFAKLVSFKEMIKKGLTDDEAWKAAESATFNYSHVTPFVRQLRSAIWGVPFITFPLKATPIAIEAALKHTSRVSFFGKFRTAMENLSGQKETEEEKRQIPDYIRNGFFVKLPMKDERGRSSYFDLTYIIPFGDLLSGQLFERPISRETGLKESPVLTLASKNPALNVIKEIMRNQTFSGQRIWRGSDSLPRQLSDLNIHLVRTMSPPWMGDQLPGGYNDVGERVSTGFARSLEEGTDPNQRRTFIQELFKNIGLKVTPFEVDVQESINDYNKSKGLQNLLKDYGYKDFSRVYQPK